jgi:hypothetical protein
MYWAFHLSEVSILSHEGALDGSHPSTINELYEEGEGGRRRRNYFNLTRTTTSDLTGHSEVMSKESGHSLPCKSPPVSCNQNITYLDIPWPELGCPFLASCAPMGPLK